MPHVGDPRPRQSRLRTRESAAEQLNGRIPARTPEQLAVRERGAANDQTGRHEHPGGARPPCSHRSIGRQGPYSWPESELLLQVEGEQAVAGGDGDVLPAVEQVGLRTVGQLRSELRVPEDLAGGRVERDEVAGRIAGEDQSAAGREDAGLLARSPAVQRVLVLPLRPRRCGSRAPSAATRTARRATPARARGRSDRWDRADR